MIGASWFQLKRVIERRVLDALTDPIIGPYRDRGSAKTAQGMAAGSAVAFALALELEHGWEALSCRRSDHRQRRLYRRFER